MDRLLFDGWMVVWLDGGMFGWLDGWMDGWLNSCHWMKQFALISSDQFDLEMADASGYLCE